MLLRINFARSSLLQLASLALVCCMLLVSVAPSFGEEQEESPKQAVIQQIIHFIKEKNIRLRDETLLKMANTVYDESQLRELDYRLILAVIKVESNFRHDAVSRRGAQGLMQIKPSLAKYIAKDVGVQYNGRDSLTEPENNIKLGVYFLSRLMDDFKDMGTALHAYNAGPAKLRGKLSRDKEPKNRFARHVLNEYHKNIEVLPDGE
ncbi:MAG TPA: lytic transglycosylase domain-containing protein [Syntrophorhabdales bacterium]|nr:lytic transglycosylase domain-containing protein [Syntrophorhabdales bacterium]